MEGYHIIVFCVEHEHGTLDSWQPSEINKNTFRLGVVKTLDSWQPSEMIKNTFRLGVVKTLDSWQPSEINKNTFRLGVVKTLDSWQPSSKQGHRSCYAEYKTIWT